MVRIISLIFDQNHLISLIFDQMSMTTSGTTDEEEKELETEEGTDKEETEQCPDSITFECDEANKAEIHDTLANM